MKKLVSLMSVVAALVAMFVLAVPAQAAGAISTDEQRILTELDKGVTVNGKTFNITASDRTQAENYLKQHDVSTTAVDTVVKNIQAARTLAEAQNVDVTNINTLTDLILAFSTDVTAQLKDYVVAAANALGLKVTFGPGTVSIVDPNGGNAVYTSGNAVKQTGATYIVSFAALGTLLAIAAGAFVVGKKARLA